MDSDLEWEHVHEDHIYKAKLFAKNTLDQEELKSLSKIINRTKKYKIYTL